MEKVIRKYLCSRCKKQYKTIDTEPILYVFDYSKNKYRKCCLKCFDELNTKKLVEGYVSLELDYYVKENFMKTFS